MSRLRSTITTLGIVIVLTAAILTTGASPAAASTVYLPSPNVSNNVYWACVDDYGENIPGVDGTATTGPDWYLQAQNAEGGYCTSYWWTGSNGYNPSGKDYFRWYAYPGPWVTCRIYIYIPYKDPSGGYPFNRGATYTVYTASRTVELGSTILSQDANSQHDIGTAVDIGSWTANGSGNLSVVLDDSDYWGYTWTGSHERTVATGAEFDCG